MPKRIRFIPKAGKQNGTLAEIPAFPGETFATILPEAIGDVERIYWGTKPTWTSPRPHVWVSTGTAVGEFSFEVTIGTRSDTVDIRTRLKNESTRVWKDSMAFNCFRCNVSASISDHECVRHWARNDGKFKRLPKLHRKYGPRPTVQVYAAEGAPPVSSTPFAQKYHATSNDMLEDWLAIQSRDGTRLVAVVSKPALFMFQNMEFSCIHAVPSLGSLAPGETGEALTRLYLVESSLGDWYDRMRSEMG